MVSKRPIDDPSERPAEFDARVMAYLPGLKRLARRYAPPAYRDDLVTDTIVRALERWRSFREDGGLWLWLVWTMRGVVSNRAVTATRQKRSAVMIPIDDAAGLSTQATQADQAELAQAVDLLASVPHGHIVLRVAMGDTYAAIADDLGCSVEWARQMHIRGRAAFDKALAARQPEKAAA